MIYELKAQKVNVSLHERTLFRRNSNVVGNKGIQEFCEFLNQLLKRISTNNDIVHSMI